MIPITNAFINDSGGLLRALVYKSAEYLEGIIGRSHINDLKGKERYVRRIITHSDPHLDEYFADLLLMAALPTQLRRVPFEEQTIFSEDDDTDCKLTWPSSIVLGLGASVSGGATPLVFFDEHSADQTRSAASCCQLTADTLFTWLPDSIRILMHEANSIDQFASAHDQSLANIIKDFHGIRFAFQRDESTGTEVSDFLTPEWKRALVHTCLTAVVYCLEKGVDLHSAPEGKVDAFMEPLERYRGLNLRRSHEMFKTTDERTKSLYCDQEKVFRESGLKAKTATGIVTQRDQTGQEIPQLLIASRVIFACKHCWGDAIASMIALHIFEVEYQAQLNFKIAQREIETMFAKNYSFTNTSIGMMEQSSLPPVFIKGVRKQAGRELSFQGQYPLVVLGLSPNPGVIKPNRAARNFINKHKSGLGIIFINDTALGTRAIFKCDNTPYDKWAKFCAALEDLEPNSWSWQKSGGRGYDYILNGTKAHRYKEPTSLNFKSLLRLLRKTFY
jgi:hypothetical protein